MTPRLPGLGDWVPGARPTARTSLPFVLLMGLGVLTALLPPYDAEPLRLVLAAGLAAVLYGFHRQALRRPERTWLDRVAPMGSFGLIFLLRDVTGGADSGLTALAAVPLMWLAMFGTRRDVWAAAGLLGLLFLVPGLLIGGEAYPVPEWRRAVVWTGFAVLIPPTVQRVVRQLAVETRRNRETAARLEGVVRGATLSSLITTDVAGRITSFGVGASSQLGYRPEDVEGHDLAGVLLVDSELAAAARELEVRPGFGVLARLAHQQAGSRIWTMVRADGERLFVRMAVTELRDEEDVLTGYLCVSIDATTAIVSQNELSQAEERWRVLMDHLPDTTVIMVEESTGITLVTGAGVLVRRLRDGAGRRLTEIVDRDRPGTLAGMLETAFAGGEAPVIHVPVGGAEHEFTVSPLPSSGDRRQALVMVRDVSRDRRRERVLTAAKDRAERMFEDAPQGMALLDPTGVVTRANPALQELLGQQELVGRPLSHWSFESDDPSIEAHLAEVRETGNHRSETPVSVRGPYDEELHVVLISTLLDAEPGEVDRILTNVVDVSERHRYELRLAYLAEHDPLTGLANRRRFDQQLAQHMEECLRYGPRGALLMLDLDHFKLVNDTLGHAVGDDLLVEVSEVLGQRMRSSDLVARLGGDEFAILLPQADRKAAELVAASIVERVAKDVSAHNDARSTVSVSIGGVTIGAGHRSADDLLSAADSAMYVAKQSGRNRYTFLGIDRDD